MSNPDKIEMDEGWISDAESVIHQHCRSDSSDASHNDWVHDLAVGLWRTLRGAESIAQLVAERDGLNEELEAMRARGGDRARLTCPHCPGSVEELPVLRCIKCGCGYYDEVGGRVR